MGHRVAGAFIRSLVAISANPPRSAASYELQIAVKDVLGPTFTSASADNMLISIQPRATNIFQPQKAFLLVRKRTTPFTDTPEEFFCLNALRDVPFRNVTQVTCSVQDEICCCASYILLHVPVQDLRLRSAECSFQPTERYHVGGLVEGLLRTSEGVARPARLHSSYKVYATMPPEVTAQDKKPIRFDLLVLMPFEEYQESLNTRLIQELTDAVFIPKDLVEILKVEPGETLSTGGTTLFTISFYVEPRCLQELGPEVELLSFGINTKDGCNLLAPVEYMTELKTQLSNRDSALFYQQDLVLLNKVHPERSFAFVEQHLCNREPFWEFGAVADSEGECPFDLVKLSTVGTVTLTLSLALLLGLLARAAHQCGCCLRLAKVRILDVLTPIMGLYTTGADYVWLFYLQGNNAHPLHTTLFMGCLCNLFLCFVVNAAVLRMMLTSYIIDTPWWRKNRKRLRLILLLSVLSPRFFRITNSHIGAIDRTHIHFGTPSGVEHDIHEERAADCEMQFLASQPILPDYEMETLQDDVVQDSGSWTEADVDASLRVEQDIHEERAAHSQMQFSDAVPDIDKVSPPRRKRMRPEKVEVSPRTEALFFEHSRNDRGRISPLHEADSPRHRKYKLWYQNEVWVSSSEEETEEGENAASSVLETRVKKKQFKFGQCPHCGLALHAAVPETGSLAGCYVVRQDESGRRTCWFVKRLTEIWTNFLRF
eukprot:symbB.v1.2.015149.t1/scaffold1124.1/size136573/15